MPLAAPRSAVAGASFDHVDVGLGDEPQQLGRLLAHVLRPRVTGEMHGDAAVERLKALGEPLVLGDVDDVFADVAGRCGKRP